MLHLSTILKHYKRSDVQQAILANAKYKEVGVRYAKGGFGKRPQVVVYPKDILQFAQEGVTSFHISEEHWRNPMLLRTGLSIKELDEIRTGWDLIIDVDCPVWEISKLITHHIVQALYKHGVSGVSVKFSGNKGFHVGVPFKAFPDKVFDKECRLEFPEGTKRVLSYLGWYVDSQENDRSFSRDILNRYSLQELSELFGLSIAELTQSGSNSTPMITNVLFFCHSCGHSVNSKPGGYLQCPRCGSIMRPESTPNINSKKEPLVVGALNSQKILNLDAILISSRHMYRSVYSLHEKSGLCSVPVEPNKVLEFEKEQAKPESVVINSSLQFLDSSKSKSGEASLLLREAYDFLPELPDDEGKDKKFDYEVLTEAIPEEFFPTCISRLLEGVKDGRKRGVFVLLNFLKSVGWDYDMIEARLKKWNEANHEPLKQGYIESHVRYHKNNKKDALPPNCGNDLYYIYGHECHQDPFHKNIKNPVQYAKKKARYAKENAKRKPAKDKKKSKGSANPGKKGK